MHGRTFGRRVSEPSSYAPQHSYVPAGPDPDGVTRVIPQEIWDGPYGEQMRQLGFTPNDPSNLALTPDRARAMEDAATARMNAILAKVNAHIPGVSFIPWAMIPWSVFEGLNAEFLFKTDFFPSSPWNNMLLPADAYSSEFVGLPQHPRAGQPGHDENLSRLVTELRVKFREEIDRGLGEIERGDYSVLDRFEEMKNAKFQDLFAMARYVGNMVWGDEVCARHDELFGYGLSEVTD